MKHNHHNARSNPALPWSGAQLDHLIIVYEDAASLKRGFEFWLCWPRIAGETCRCVPICLAHPDRPELDELLQPSGGTSLFVLSLGSNEVISRVIATRLLRLTKRDCARQRGLILLFPTNETRSRWLRHWRLSSNQEFSLGCYTAVPTWRSGGNTEAPFPPDYELQSAPPGRGGLRAISRTGALTARATVRRASP